jgi:hypothetical protein
LELSIVIGDRWQQIEGLRGIGHQDICKEQRRKLMKGEFTKSSEPSIGRDAS